MRAIATTVRQVALAAVSGVLAGLASAAFLEALSRVTQVRVEQPWLLWLLPAGGLGIGFAYHRFGGRAAEGNALLLDEIHTPKDWVPRRMAPLVFVGTVLTHLLGGSAGREGTALQLSGSLTDAFARAVRLKAEDRRVLLIAALAGGFGSVFGVPVAGAIFGLEVQGRDRFRWAALAPALCASVVGDRVVRALHVHHAAYSPVDVPELSLRLVAQLVVAGLAFGLVGNLFVEAVHAVKATLLGLRLWPPLRPALGGAAVVALAFAVGTRDYLGLSLPLLTRSIAGGAGIVAAAFALKLVFTVVTLGTGFPGGEVTPLFVIGATLGVSLGHLLGAPVPLLAAVGFVAVFAGAARTPVACTVMGLELFGAPLAVPLAIGCVVSDLVGSRRTIYGRR